MFTDVLSPFPPLVSPGFFFLRKFFSRALLSERLEQASLFGAVWNDKPEVILVCTQAVNALNLRSRFSELESSCDHQTSVVSSSVFPAIVFKTADWFVFYLLGFVILLCLCFINVGIPWARKIQQRENLCHLLVPCHLVKESLKAEFSVCRLLLLKFQRTSSCHPLFVTIHWLVIKPVKILIAEFGVIISL